jgi:hypothetical protein
MFASIYIILFFSKQIPLAWLFSCVNIFHIKAKNVLFFKFTFYFLSKETKIPIFHRVASSLVVERGFKIIGYTHINKMREIRYIFFSSLLNRFSANISCHVYISFVFMACNLIRLQVFLLLFVVVHFGWHGLAQNVIWIWKSSLIHNSLLADHLWLCAKIVAQKIKDSYANLTRFERFIHIELDWHSAAITERVRPSPLPHCWSITFNVPCSAVLKDVNILLLIFLS